MALRKYVITKGRPRSILETSGDLRGRSGTSGRAVHR